MSQVITEGAELKQPNVCEPVLTNHPKESLWPDQQGLRLAGIYLTAFLLMSVIESPGSMV